MKVKITINVNRPEEVILRYGIKRIVCNFVALLAYPISVLCVGTKQSYVIMAVDGGLLEMNKRYEMIITSGSLLIEQGLFDGTAVIKEE